MLGLSCFTKNRHTNFSGITKLVVSALQYGVIGVSFKSEASTQEIAVDQFLRDFCRSLAPIFPSLLQISVCSDMGIMTEQFSNSSKNLSKKSHPFPYQIPTLLFIFEVP